MIHNIRKCFPIFNFILKVFQLEFNAFSHFIAVFAQFLSFYVTIYPCPTIKMGNSLR